VTIMCYPVQFGSQDTTCRGVLRLPPTARHPVPAVVLCAGFSGTQDTPALRATAETLSQAGFASLTFDYRHFGSSDGHPRQVIDLAGQRADIAAALDYVRAHPAVDRDRIGLWGTSLGGGHAVVVAAGNPAVKAVVAQVPFNGFPRRANGRSVRSTVRLLIAILVDRARHRLGLSPRYVPAVGGANSTAVMASPAAGQTVAALRSQTWVNRVAPRVLLDMMRYQPADSAPAVQVPLLVCAAALDQETPEASARAIAERAPHGRVITYPISHFDIYRDDVRHTVLTDQLHFLHRTLDDSEPPDAQAVDAGWAPPLSA
jgi:dienelactone hydrolase